MSRYAARLVAAVVLTAATGLGLPAPARAASCSTGHGVTVVVDFHQLGGGVRSACDPGGAGRNASTQVTDVGHTLTYAQRQPGFVCRVDGSPSSDPCINTSPADAYWSLWWSDGKSGTWSFSSEGIGSLTVPEGGYVGLSWQGGSGRALPRVKPRAHPAPSPSPSSSQSHAPPSPPSQSATAPASPSTNAPTTTSTRSSSPGTPSATPLGHHNGAGHQRHGHHGPGSSPSATSATDRADAARAADTVEPAGSGLPGWVGPGLVAALFVAAAGVFVVRRRGTGGS